MNDNEKFREKVYDIVKDIPFGFVLTYGMIAILADRPRNSRMVGKFLSQSKNNIPAHRVVNHAGRTVLGWTKQIEMLKKEGVIFKENDCVDLKKCLWRIK